MRLPFRTLVAIAAERCEALARPPSGAPSPVIEPQPVSEWSRLAGLDGSMPHESIIDVCAAPQDCGEHHPDTVTHRALQKLTLQSVTERRRTRDHEVRYRAVRSGLH